VRKPNALYHGMLTISSEQKACLPRARAGLALTEAGAEWTAAVQPGNRAERALPRATAAPVDATTPKAIHGFGRSI
jgi:hypothetical protein